LVSLLSILQDRERITASKLAEELEVSERTVLRDIDELSGAGVPVCATRGPRGGFQLLEGYHTDLGPPRPTSTVDRCGTSRRARVRISPEGRRLAAVLQVLQPLRINPHASPDTDSWIEATCRIRSDEGTTIDLLSLGPEIEVLAPADLRDAVAHRALHTARLYPTSDTP